ncbi:hypothetical protein [Collimonas fungivorans]|uniref:hypothetical protein n=1 Tax=Collimonas fungivorans TaxID=158899 RepID=UPI003FA3CDDE
MKELLFSRLSCIAVRLRHQVPYMPMQKHHGGWFWNRLFVKEAVSVTMASKGFTLSN